MHILGGRPQQRAGWIQAARAKGNSPSNPGADQLGPHWDVARPTVEKPGHLLGLIQLTR